MFEPALECDSYVTVKNTNSPLDGITCAVLGIAHEPIFGIGRSYILAIPEKLRLASYDYRAVALPEYNLDIAT